MISPSLFRRLAVLLTAVALVTCDTGTADSPGSAHTGYTSPYTLVPDGPVDKVILFIGDGMSFAQLTAGRIARHGVTRRLSIERMPVTGYIYTHALDELITDSAAGATAMATGFKTRNGMIAMLPDGTRVRTVLEAAEAGGRATGVVATSSVTHATPAAFVAHVETRKNETEIARQMVESPVDVILGGGRHFFVPQSIADSRRDDDLDLVAAARANGFRYVDSPAALADADGERLLGLFKMDALRGDSDEPSLAEMTRKAITTLDRDPDGFFLMVEGSQVDWGGHDNDRDYVVRELLALEDAVEAALEYAREDGRTLVVVTADHETGGMAIEGGEMAGGSVEADWTSGSHTAIPVPVFAYGPGALRFMGVQDNTAIARHIGTALGARDFPESIAP